MNTPTITLELPVQIYTDIKALADASQVDVIEMLRRWTVASQESPNADTFTYPPSPPRAFQRILDRATDLGVDDLAEQHDHYLYGLEKR